jgi:Arc/MetJ family transcription regulator
MSRTNIDIDDELIERVMRRYRLPSKRAAVELALRRLAGEPMSRDEALSMEGTGWSGNLDAMREPDATAWLGDATAGS